MSTTVAMFSHWRGKRIYQPGDSVLLQQHVEDFSDAGVLFRSPTLHNTHIDASFRMIDAIRRSWVFPQHFGTYHVMPRNSYWTEGYPEEVQAPLPADLKDAFHILRQDEVFTV